MAKAAALAQHPDALARLRMSLRPRLLQSPIGDAKTYARHLEAAYLEMWQRWCHSQRQAVESPAQQAMPVEL